VKKKTFKSVDQKDLKKKKKVLVVERNQLLKARPITAFVQKSARPLLVSSCQEK
jgi:hypothetical protein